MLRFPVFALAYAAFAVLLGLGLSYFAIADGRFFGAYQWGPWIAWPEVGSPTPDPYTRAYLARSSSLQLGRGEGIQFIATHDSDGQFLTGECSYLITGSTPVASFWTLRATDQNGANIARPDTQASLHSKRLARTNDGIAEIHIGRDLQPGNWLEIQTAERFQLILTFYDASFFAGFGANISALPEIRNEGCQ